MVVVNMNINMAKAMVKVLQGSAVTLVG